MNLNRPKIVLAHPRKKKRPVSLPLSATNNKLFVPAGRVTFCAHALTHCTESTVTETFRYLQVSKSATRESPPFPVSFHISEHLLSLLLSRLESQGSHGNLTHGEIIITNQWCGSIWSTGTIRNHDPEMLMRNKKKMSISIFSPLDRLFINNKRKL